jgi:hypothetical protein
MTDGTDSGCAPMTAVRTESHSADARRWPEFLVSSRHEQARMTPRGEQFVPHGLWHARRSGSARAACGLVATEWHYFWTLSFDQAGPLACRECSEALRAAEVGAS